MRVLRLLLVAVVVLCALGGGATVALATPCGTSSYAVSGGTLTIVGGSGCTLTINVSGSSVYFIASTGLWSGTPSGGLGATGTVLEAPSTQFNAISIVDASAPFALDIAGTDIAGTPIPWDDPLTVTQTDPGSTTDFTTATNLTSPISFGTVAVSVTSPSITVNQTIAAASQVVLNGTAATPMIRAGITASGTPGTITMNGARIRNVGLITLTATRTIFTGAVVGVESCSGVDVSYCSIGPATLEIDGALTADSSLTSLNQLTVTGDAVLDGDVSTAATQNWQGRVYVTKLGRITFTGAVVSTPLGIDQYGGPCDVSGLSVCGLGPSIPAPSFTDLTVAGDWQTGGSLGAADSVTVTGLTTLVGTGLYAPFTPTTTGTQDYLGGLSILLGRSAILAGSTITIAGMPEQVAPGSLGAAACQTGPVTVLGSLRLTAAVACAGSILVNGATTIAADVATDGYQSYQGPVTIALGTGTVRLRAPAEQQVAFPDTTVAATWSAASGDVAGYSASIAPTGQSCTTTGALTCSFGAVPSGADLVFSATPLRPVAAAGAPSTSRGTGTAAAASTLRRTVARGSQTPLARLIEPPATRGRRVWAERGPCTIDDGRLIAPRRRASCTLTLQVRRNGKTAWSGRALIAVR